jgi:hypothetical protein
MKDPTTRSIFAAMAAVAAMIAYTVLGRGADLTEGAFVFFLVMAGQVLDWHVDRAPRAGSAGMTAAVITFGGGTALATAMLLTGARAYPLSWLAFLAVAGLWSWLTRRTAYFVPAVYASAVLVDVLGDGRQPHQFTGWLIAYAVGAWVAQIAAGIRVRRARVTS